MFKKKPSAIEEKLNLRDKREGRFDAGTVLPKLAMDLVGKGVLPEDWTGDFDAERGPGHLRRLQADAIQWYIREVDVTRRHHSVTEVYESVAKWAATTHPWAASRPATPA